MQYNLLCTFTFKLIINNKNDILNLNLHLFSVYCTNAYKYMQLNINLY